MLLVDVDAVGQRQTCSCFALLLPVYELEVQVVPAVHRREYRYDQCDGYTALPKTH
jgi:hypothetical protein